MGGTYSSNPRNLPTVNHLLPANYSNNRRNMNTQTVPPILENYKLPDSCNDKPSAMQQTDVSLEDCEPHLFPKIPTTTQSVPVSNPDCFRIHPIKQKGVKLSDTHYWIMNEPNHKRSYSERMKRHPADSYVNAKIIGREQFEEPELPYDLNEQISQEYIRTRPVKRGQSENHKDYLYNMHRGLVVRMLLHIANATETECNSVLIGANWDFEVAEKRLKVDMLHRKGFVNQQRCTQLLEKYQWNLSEAERQAEKEFKQMLLERQRSSISSRSHQSDDVG